MSQNQNLHSLTKLTEFARDFENQPETLLGRFVNRIQNAYNHSYNAVNEMSSINQTPNISNNPNARSEFYTNLPNSNYHNTDNCHVKSNECPSISTTPSNPDNHESDMQTEQAIGENVAANPEYQIQEGRTMVNVLLRIRNLVTAKNAVSTFTLVVPFIISQAK